VVVATQLAGRGVDIRLSAEAKAKGGMALFGLGYAEERRYDQQLLGRAGRQGDPFSARFITSLEDHLWQIIGASRAGWCPGSCAGRSRGCTATASCTG
jgi:preprotein translocase subunit SecA